MRDFESCPPILIATRTLGLQDKDFAALLNLNHVLFSHWRAGREKMPLWVNLSIFTIVKHLANELAAIWRDDSTLRPDQKVLIDSVLRSTWPWLRMQWGLNRKRYTEEELDRAARKAEAFWNAKGGVIRFVLPPIFAIQEESPTVEVEVEELAYV